MSLDAIVFSSVKLVRAGDPDEAFEDKHEDDMHDVIFYLYAHPDFPVHADGLQDGYYRVKRPGGDLDVGLPTEYFNHWRDELCRLVSGEPIESVWRKKVVAPSFMALLDFADDEGIIGPAHCASLAKDFAEWHARAKAHADELAKEDEELGRTWFDVYEAWAAAFSAAANQGVVQFQ